MICSWDDGCEMKVLLLGRLFMFALLAERFIRGEYIRYRYLAEVPRDGKLVLQWREVAGIDWI